MIGLPPDFIGSIQDTASTATLVTMITARERATNYAVNEVGASRANTLTAYCSVDAHSSVEKAAKIAGIGSQHLRRIAIDGANAMQPSALAHAIELDIDAGRQPICVVATIGTTSVSGFDPIWDIAEITREHGIWLHVDAAWAGSALIVPEHRALIRGVEYVDSFVFNPHKWLFTNFDCSALYVRDPRALLNAFAILPEYLKTQ